MGFVYIHYRCIRPIYRYSKGYPNSIPVQISVNRKWAHNSVRPILQHADHLQWWIYSKFKVEANFSLGCEFYVDIFCGFGRRKECKTLWFCAIVQSYGVTSRRETLEFFKTITPWKMLWVRILSYLLCCVMLWVLLVYIIKSGSDSDLVKLLGHRVICQTVRSELVEDNKAFWIKYLNKIRACSLLSLFSICYVFISYNYINLL
jgi:hypothetical protein